MKTVVSMNSQGRLTVPAAVRAALHVEGPVQFELEIEENALVLRPRPLAQGDDDDWAYTPENIARVERARRQGRERKGRAMTEVDLARTPTR